MNEITAILALIGAISFGLAAAHWRGALTVFGVVVIAAASNAASGPGDSAIQPALA